MPYHWVKIHSSPPQERRDEIAGICIEHGARLVDNEIFYDDEKGTFALVALPEDEEAALGLMDELGAYSWVGLVNADEKAEGLTPPDSGPPQEAA